MSLQMDATGLILSLQNIKCCLPRFCFERILFMVQRDYIPRMYWPIDKQCRPWSDCAIWSGFTLFAKVHFCEMVRKELMNYPFHVLSSDKISRWPFGDLWKRYFCKRARFGGKFVQQYILGANFVQGRLLFDLWKGDIVYSGVYFWNVICPGGAINFWIVICTQGAVFLEFLSARSNHLVKK